MLSEKRNSMLHGVLLIALFSCAAFYIGDMEFIKKLSFSPMIVGIILGMLYANSLRNNLPETWVPGIQFCSKRILRIGIILYGFKLTFQFLLRNKSVCYCNFSVLGAVRRFHNGAVTDTESNFTGVKVVRLAPLFEFYTNYIRHLNLTSKTAAANQSATTETLPPSSRRFFAEFIFSMQTSAACKE